MLRPIATHGLTVDPIEIASGDGIPGQAARERATVLLEKIPPDSPFRVKLGWDQAPARSVAAVPLVFRDTLHGVLVVGSLRDLSKDAIAFLEASATQLGIGLQ
ncbi:MAG: GAF domain-containing protein, partial [Gammaproteobacteria bacterium]